MNHQHSDPYKYEGQDEDADEGATVSPAEMAADLERCARLAEEAAVRAEFDAAWEAAAREVTVIDEDGGTSVDRRVSPDWSFEGCRSEAALLAHRIPRIRQENEARYAASVSAAKVAMAFEDAEKALGETGRRERVRALAPIVQRELPKWLRRLI